MGAKAGTPVIGVSMGDPGGVGPEIIVKACERFQRPDVQVVVFGVPEVMERAVALAGSTLRVQVASSPSVGTSSAQGNLWVVAPETDVAPSIRWGEVSSGNGYIALRCLTDSIAAARAGRIQAIVSAPANKEALAAAGMRATELAEWVAKQLGNEQYSLASVLGSLWIFRVTSHIAFKDIVNHLTRERVADTVRTAYHQMRRVGVDEPRLALAALNPHAGEGGIYGTEEMDVLAPALEDLAREGIRCVGPVPADSVFARARQGQFDGVIALYHDQANIAIKSMGFVQGVTAAVGLPFPYLTPAHGTGFDIAWQGRSDEAAMLRALELAADMLAP